MIGTINGHIYGRHIFLKFNSSLSIVKGKALQFIRSMLKVMRLRPTFRTAFNIDKRTSSPGRIFSRLWIRKFRPPKIDNAVASQ